MGHHMQHDAPSAQSHGSKAMSEGSGSAAQGSAAQEAAMHAAKSAGKSAREHAAAEADPMRDHGPASGRQALSVRAQPGVPAPAAAPSVPAKRTLLPSVASVVQAGAFGAALGGIGTGVSELARVKQGEISSDEAIRNIVKSSAQGATTMAVASVAGHMVRAHPVVGIVVLAAAGIGALTVLSNVKPKKKTAVAKAPRTGTAAAKTAKKAASGSTNTSAGNALPSA